jgi:hypothetical protein
MCWDVINTYPNTLFETVKNRTNPPTMGGGSKHERETNMVKSTNVVALKNNDARINVVRKIKSHNEVSKKKPLPIASGDFNVVVDFSTCSPAEIMAIAVDAIIVTVQAKTRSAYFAKTNIGKDGKTPVKSFNMIMKENIPAVINVKDAIVSKARTPGKSLFEKTGDMLAKMNPEERAAMLKRLSNIK